eukprot:2275955-Pleurochrysis_carterae.AAC.1
MHHSLGIKAGTDQYEYFRTKERERDVNITPTASRGKKKTTPEAEQDVGKREIKKRPIDTEKPIGDTSSLSTKMATLNASGTTHG